MRAVACGRLRAVQLFQAGWCRAVCSTAAGIAKCVTVVQSGVGSSKCVTARAKVTHGRLAGLEALGLGTNKDKSQKTLATALIRAAQDTDRIGEVDADVQELLSRTSVRPIPGDPLMPASFDSRLESTEPRRRSSRGMPNRPLAGLWRRLAARFATGIRTKRTCGLIHEGPCHFSICGRNTRAS